jgi:LysR family transcriptional regulator, nitrogen assimilation regulatory protein
MAILGAYSLSLRYTLGMKDRLLSVPLSAVRIFLSAAEFKNLTRTAEALGMTQPSLSRILTKLERDLGVELFVRSKRGVQLTEAGAHFRTRASVILRQMDGLVSELRTPEQSPTGRIAVGIPTVMTDSLTGPLADWFASELPRACFAAHEGNSREIEFELSLGRLDLALLMSTDTRSRNLETCPLASEQVYLHGPRGSNLDSGRPVGWNALSSIPLILPSQSNVLRRKIEEASRKHQFAFNVIMEVNSPSSRLSLVERGVGYTLAPGCASYWHRERGSVIASPVRGFNVVWTLTKSKQPAQPALIRVTERKIRDLVAAQAELGVWRAVG